MAAVDVFDALTSERLYKKALSVPEAVEIIKDNMGKHFDPLIVHQ
jgi:putative two-component system response regulator